MKRIDSFGHVGNRFQDGDGATGVLGTDVSSVWLNGVQEELAAVIEAAGLELDGADDNQLLQALSKLSGRYYPTMDVAQAAAVAGTFKVGDLALIGGYAVEGDGGKVWSARAVVEGDGFSDIHDRLAVATVEAGHFGVKPSAIRNWETWSLSGADVAASLSDYLNAAMNSGQNSQMPNGEFRVDSDLYLLRDADENPDAPVRPGEAGFVLSGAGMPSVQWSKRGTSAIGTVLHFADNKRMIFAGVGQSMTDIGITGSVESGALVTLGSASTQFGGVRRVSVHNRVPPTASSTDRPIALDITDGFLGDSEHIYAMGGIDVNARRKNPLIASADLTMPSIGVRFRGEAGGTLAEFGNVSAAGCGTAIQAGDPNSDKQIGSLVIRRAQGSFSNTGLSYRAGVERLEIPEAHFEANDGRHMYIYDGAGEGEFSNIRISTPTRTTSGGAVISYMNDAAVVIGHPDPALNRYRKQTFTRGVAEFMTQPTFMIYGGPVDDVGLVRINQQEVTNKGEAPLVVINDVQGLVQCIITNPFVGAESTGFGWSGSVARFTRNGDYTQHSYMPDLTAVRFEGAPVNVTISSTLDLQGRLAPPSALSLNSTGGDVPIIIDDMPLSGMTIDMVKRFGANSGRIEIVDTSVMVPDHISIDDDGTGTTITQGGRAVPGNVILLSDVGAYTLTKLSPGFWSIR